MCNHKHVTHLDIYRIPGNLKKNKENKNFIAPQLPLGDTLRLSSYYMRFVIVYFLEIATNRVHMFVTILIAI